MNNLFPIKLFGLLNTLQKHEPWMQRQHALAGIPNDNLTRIVLVSRGIHCAYSGKVEHPRFRLAFPTDEMLVHMCQNTFLEVYSCDEKFVERFDVTKMDQHLSVALEVELLTDILSIHNYHVTTV